MFDRHPDERIESSTIEHLVALKVSAKNKQRRKGRFRLKVDAEKFCEQKAWQKIPLSAFSATAFV